MPRSSSRTWRWFRYQQLAPEGQQDQLHELDEGGATLRYRDGGGEGNDADGLRGLMQPASRTLSKRRHRKQAIIYTASFGALAILILAVAWHNQPHWHTAVDQYLSSSSDGQKAAPPAQPTANEGDTLPALDWTWSKASGGGLASWFSRPPKLGSSEWLRRYPDFVHGPDPRQSWLVRYKAARQLGLIPDLPKAELMGGLASYPDEFPNDEKLCSYRRASCISPEDIYKAPAASWAINFDDGPLPPSAKLYEALDVWDAKATHFWVGNNVKNNLQLAVQAAERGDHLAVHTWSHPHLTTYTDEQIVGELGWTMQIIYDVSSYLPRYYRPPYGDVDNRVRAIATHVFNMTCVLWNHDSFDWSLNQTWASGDFVDPPYDWLTTDMSTARLTDRMAENDPTNGEGVIVLEHELSFESVQAFTDSYPKLKVEKWRSGTVPDLLDVPWYQ